MQISVTLHDDAFNSPVIIILAIGLVVVSFGLIMFLIILAIKRLEILSKILKIANSYLNSKRN